MNYINTMEDLFHMLDRYTEGVDWNTFYTKRDKPALFLKYNTTLQLMPTATLMPKQLFQYLCKDT